MVNYTSKQIVEQLLKVKKQQIQNRKQHIEWHGTVYDDGVWKIDFELHPYGQIRIWISREDSYGNYNASPFTVYRADNGEIRYSADLKIKKSLVNKLISIFKEMEKSDLGAYV